MSTTCEIYELGMVDYISALNLQNGLLSARLAGDIPDSILLLEHPPVFTIGASGKDEHIVVSPSVLNENRITVLRADRGGSITYHGPGQVVGYFIMDLNAQGLNIHQFVHCLEEVVIKTLNEFFIEAVRDRDYPGVWVNSEKVCALGIRVMKGCTKHGFALNVNNDLKYFDYIIPCGIKDRGVTSMSELLSRNISVEAVNTSIIENCALIFNLEIRYKVVRQLNGLCV